MIKINHKNLLINFNHLLEDYSENDNYNSVFRL